MRHKFVRFLAATAIMVTIIAPAAAQRDRDSELLERMLKGGPMLDQPELNRIIAAAAASPLGSAANPVRAAQPKGQRAYLERLRCGDGRKPTFERGGNIGSGIYTSIVDLYIVDCGDASPGKVNVQIDMYFPGYVEQQAVPGFTIIPE